MREFYPNYFAIFLKNFSTVLLLAAILCVPFTARAQVTIGATTPPRPFSVLELVGEQAGFRLPQLTQQERQDLEDSDEFQYYKDSEAKGLKIFNMNTRCVDIWNGEKWLSLCEDTEVTTTPAPGTIIMGRAGADQNISLTMSQFGTNIFRMDTNSYIDLPPGRWNVEYLVPLRFNLTSTGNWIAVRFVFLREGSAITSSTGWNQVYGPNFLNSQIHRMHYSQMVVNNTNTTQRYFLHVGQFTSSTTALLSNTFTLWPTGWSGRIMATFVSPN